MELAIPQLFQIDGVLIARVIHYHLDTPRATATVEIVDAIRWHRLCAATEFIDWIEQQQDVSDAEYDSELQQRHLRAEDVRLDRGGLQWLDGNGVAQPIYDPRCHGNSIEWRM